MTNFKLGLNIARAYQHFVGIAATLHSVFASKRCPGRANKRTLIFLFEAQTFDCECDSGLA